MISNNNEYIIIIIIIIGNILTGVSVLGPLLFLYGIPMIAVIWVRIYFCIIC